MADGAKAAKAASCHATEPDLATGERSGEGASHDRQAERCRTGGSDATDAPDWIGIERAYRGSSLTVVQICAVFRISTKCLYERRAADGWPRRSDLKRKVGAVAPSSPPDTDALLRGGGDDGTPDLSLAQEVPVPTGGAALRDWRNGMVVRLYTAMDRQLAEIEQAQLSTARLSGADRERQTRQMNVMTRSMEKLTEFHEQEIRRKAESRKAAGARTRKAKRDPETWRLEIARRITRIREKWLAEEAASDD